MVSVVSAKVRLSSATAAADEKNDEFANPLDIVIDAGAKAMLAALAEDREEELRQVKRGRAAYRKLHGFKMESVEVDLPQRKKKKRSGVKIGTSLGDLFKQAGVDKVDEED